jgi:hypothetical protein
MRLDQHRGRAILACAMCGTAVRLLQRHGDPEPAFDLDDAQADVPPPGSWWLGFVKGADAVLRPVALASTLSAAWDAVLSCPLRGAIILTPTDPPQRTSLFGSGEDEDRSAAEKLRRTPR